MVENFRSPSKIARRLRLTPLVAREIASWPRFMCNYALGLVPDAPYAFRNRAKLRIGRGVDHVPIIEIFLRRDYGAVADGSVVLDLGANIGAFSVYAATTARNARIYAYEPMPDFFRLLQENIALNRLAAVVTCVNAAVGGKSGNRELFVENEGFSFPTLLAAEGNRAARNIRVACTTIPDILDSNGLDRVDLVKMDCEGAEYEILYDLPSAVFDRIGEIRLEYHNLDAGRCNLAALTSFLKGRNYEIRLSKPVSPGNGNLWARKHA